MVCTTGTISANRKLRASRNPLLKSTSLTYLLQVFLLLFQDSALTLVYQVSLERSNSSNPKVIHWIRIQWPSLLSKAPAWSGPLRMWLRRAKLLTPWSRICIVYYRRQYSAEMKDWDKPVYCSSCQWRWRVGFASWGYYKYICNDTLLCCIENSRNESHTSTGN